MSENNLLTSCSSAATVQSETPRDEIQDFGIILYKMPFNEIQSQNDCNETAKRNGEQMTKKSQHSSMADDDVPEMLHIISEATNLFEIPPRRRGSVTKVGKNVSCFRDTPVTVRVYNNLPTVNTSVEKNGSEVLTESAETNKNEASEISYEEKRWLFYRQRIQIEDTIIISSDDDSELASNVPEHSPFHSIADISVEYEVNDQRQTNSFSVSQDSFITEFHMKQDNLVAPTTDIPLENEFSDQQQNNSSDVPKDSFNSIADIPVKAVITDQNETNVSADISKESLNSIVNVTVENAVTDQIHTTSLMDLIADITVKNEVIIEQTDFIDIIVKSEECESPTKEIIDVTECNKPVHYDITDCYKSLDDDNEDSLKEFTLIVSEDDSDLESVKFPSKELSNVEDTVSDKVILFNDSEAEAQEALLNVDCKELEVRKLQEKYHALKTQQNKLRSKFDKILQLNINLQKKLINCKCNTKVQHPVPVQVQLQTNDNDSPIQTDSAANALLTPAQWEMFQRSSPDIPKMINELATTIFTKQELVFNTATKLDLSKKLLIIKTIEELTNTRLKMSDLNFRLNKKIQNSKRTHEENSTKKRKLSSQGACTSSKKKIMLSLG